MSEHFDLELAHAVKQGAAKSLEGWEFTPAMQRSVLERIERAAAGTVPAASPSRRFEPGRVIRPLAWTAVAAAALVVVVNTRMGERGPVANNAPAGSAAQSAPATRTAKGGSDSAAQDVAPAPVPPASGNGAAGTGNTGAREAQPGSFAGAPLGGPAAPAGSPAAAPVRPPAAATAQPPAAAPARPPAAAAIPDRTPESNQPTVTKVPSQSTQTAGPGDQTPSSTPPQSVGIASAPAEAGGKPQVPAPSAYHGGMVALLVPPAAPKGTRTMGLMAVASDKLRVQAVRGRVVELSHSAVCSLAPDGAEGWTYPLVGATDESLLAVADDGSVAVAVANKLHVLTPEGKLVRTLEPAGSVTGLAWGAGGRLAIAAGSIVTVVRPATAAAEFHTEAISQPELSFGPDGMLAVLGDGKSGRELLLYDQGGAVRARVQLGRSTARGLAVTGGNVVAGSQAYGLLGRPLWQAPFAPQGLTLLTGSDLLVARKADTVVALRAGDGVPVWQAAWSGAGQGLQRVVAAPDGRFLGVLGSTDEGWVLWVLNQQGRVLYAERLPEPPSDMAFVGDRLLLLTPQGAEFRSFPQ